jgi:tetratricopeptide (TPR) repeat protein
MSAAAEPTRPNAPPPSPRRRREARLLGRRAAPIRAWLLLPLLAFSLLILPAAALAGSPQLTPRIELAVSGCTAAPWPDAAGGTPAWPGIAGPGSSEGGATADKAATRVTGGKAALFEQALAASRAGGFAAALPLWDAVLQRDPEDAAAWSNRGNVRLALGDAEGAIADQERAMALDPRHPDPHLNRGTAEESLGRWQAAAADYQWILERDPLEASALYNLGNVNGSLGDWQAARDCFSAAALARPGFAMARSSAALAAFQLGELEEAETQLRALIRRYPLFADARAGLTALLWSRGAHGEAESHWVAASGLDPRYRQADWLLQIRRWPPKPVQLLQQFLSLS